MKSSNQEHEALEAEYRRRYNAVLVPLAASLATYISECLGGQPRIDRINARAKDVSRFIQKAVGTQRLYDMFVQQPDKQFTLTVSGLERNVRVQTTRFDREHGSVLDAWLTMGAPEQILREDLDVLRQKMELEMNVEYHSPAPDLLTLNVTVQPHGVTLVDISESAF